jgi:AbrB family looped-hinge helix DNA binding protein
MRATVDAAGRVVIPKPLRDALGIEAGASVDISFYGSGLHLVPHGRTARLVEENGLLVATGDGEIDDEVVRALIESGRR